jgi:hypothetical protein
MYLVPVDDETVELEELFCEEDAVEDDWILRLF